MKIVLVNVIEFEPVQEYLRGISGKSSTNYPPIGLLTLTAVLESRGHEVEVIDFGNLILSGEIECDDLLHVRAARYLQGRHADVVGFSSRCDNYLHSLRIAEQFHKSEPRAPIVFGGPQATITDEASINNFPFIDCVVRHEAEFSFPALLDALNDGRPFDDIPGIVYRRNGQVVKNPDPPLILDLDEIPMPSFKHFPIETLSAMPIEVGRGCPFGCTFCVTNRYFNRRYRLKSADRIVDEVIWLQERYGFSRFNFIHDMLTASRHLVMQLCKRIKDRGVKIEWSCSARTDCVDRELLEAMRAAGCRDMYFGIETGSQRMQKVVNKNLKLESVFPVIDLCNELGISATTSFITGFPEEREEDVESTLRMLLELSPKVSNVQLHLYSPTPGTPLNDQFADRLVYTGYISDFGFSTSMSEEDRREVSAHPDIFTNYFQARPLYLDFESMQGLDAFGYTLQSFKHFFFYMLHEPQAPDLLGVWSGLREWIVKNEVAWDIGTYLAKGLNKELEDYLWLMLSNMPRLPDVLPEAFNFDRALLRLGRATADLSKDYQEDLQQLRVDRFSRQARNPAKLRLRAPVVLAQTRCNLARMMEAVRERKYRPLALSESPRDIAIFAVKDGRSSVGFTFAVVELNEVLGAILEACESETTLDELLEYVPIRLAERGKQRPYLEQLCLRAVERLVGLQAIRADADDAADDASARAQDAHRPALIRLNPFKIPLYNLHHAPFNDSRLAVNNSVQPGAKL